MTRLPLMALLLSSEVWALSADLERVRDTINRYSRQTRHREIGRPMCSRRPDAVGGHSEPAEVTDEGKYSSHGLSASFRGTAGYCTSYIKPNGSYGPKGAAIAKQLRTGSTLFGNGVRRKRDGTGYYDDLMSNSAGNTPSMRKICPGFNKLSKNDRVKFWVWTAAAIASAESTCGKPGSLKPHRDVTGRFAVGEFQLNYTLAHRNWRGKTWGGRYCTVPAAAMVGFETNMRCALDIMVDQFRGVYGRPPGLAGNSYWAELITKRRPSRYQTSPIIRRIREFPGCRAR